VLLISAPDACAQCPLASSHSRDVLDKVCYLRSLGLCALALAVLGQQVGAATIPVEVSVTELVESGRTTARGGRPGEVIHKRGVSRISEVRRSQ